MALHANLVIITGYNLERYLLSMSIVLHGSSVDLVCVRLSPD
jgi:hypothetical protein